MIPPDSAEELEAPRQQDEGENARGTLEYYAGKNDYLLNSEEQNR